MSSYDDGTCFSCSKLAKSERPDSTYNGSRGEAYCSRLGWVNPNSERRGCSAFDNCGADFEQIGRWRSAFAKRMNLYIVSTCIGILNPENSAEFIDAFNDTVDNELIDEEVICSLHRAGITPETLMADYDIYGKLVKDAIYAAYENPETRDITVAYLNAKVLPKLNEILELKKTGKLAREILNYVLLTRRTMKDFGIEYKQAETLEAPVFDPFTAPAAGSR